MENKKIPLGKLIAKNIILIILVSIIFLGAGLCISKFVMKPTYTATRSVILKTQIDVSSTDATAERNNVTLAKQYLPTMAKIVVMPKNVEEVNRVYHERGNDKNDTISAGNIAVKYDEKSLIFQISYTAKDDDEAIEKLDCIIEGTKNLLETQSEKGEEIVLAGKATLQSLGEANTPTKKSYVVLVTALSFVGGLILAVLFVILKYMFNNKIRDKQELAEMTGSTFLAAIKARKDENKKK